MAQRDELDIRGYFADPRLSRLYSTVADRFSKARLIAHGLDHIRRDLVNAVMIGETEECRMQMVIASILLHDIGFLYDPMTENHHATGARHCGEWLERWSDVDKAEIAECIFRHKGVTEMWNTAPESIEQNIVESLRAREYPARRSKVSAEWPS